MCRLGKISIPQGMVEKRGADFLIVLKLGLFKCPWRDIIYDEAR